MKMKSIFIYSLGAATIFAAGLTVQAQVFFTMRGLLNEHFQSSEHVSFVRVNADGPVAQRFGARAGLSGERDEYVVFVATAGGETRGYAVFDSERGQHELIDFASFFGPDGRVSRVEVVAYREAYGGGIRSTRFRRQFVGRNARSDFRPGHDIDIISGATISSHSMSRAVQRASILVDHVRTSADSSPNQ